jgi:hypothetical protein
MQTSVLSAPRLPLLTLLVALFASAPAWGQQQEAPPTQAPAVPAPYTPPQPIIIAPSTGQNPYLKYVPSAPAQPAQTAPQTPPSEEGATEKVPQGPTLTELGRSLRDYFTEDELNLLFDYMKDSVVAAFKGEDVYLPPDLAFKLEILLARMKKQGGLYMDNLVKQLEEDLKRSLKDKLAPPGSLPPPPATLPQTTPAASPEAKPAPPAGNSKLQRKKAGRTA